MINRISKNYKDIDLSFDPHPFNKDLSVKKDKAAINNAIVNLISTRPPLSAQRGTCPQFPQPESAPTGPLS